MKIITKATQPNMSATGKWIKVVIEQIHSENDLFFFSFHFTYDARLIFKLVVCGELTLVSLQCCCIM